MLSLVSTPTTTPALFGGGLLGYVMYDVTHYYLHHGQPSSEVPKNLKVRVVLFLQFQKIHNLLLLICLLVKYLHFLAAFAKDVNEL